MDLIFLVLSTSPRLHSCLFRRCLKIKSTFEEEQITLTYATLMFKHWKPSASVLKAQISKESRTTTKQWALCCLLSAVSAVWLSPSQTVLSLPALSWNAERPALLALSRPCYCTQESVDCITVSGWRRRESKPIEGGESRGRETDPNDTELEKHKLGADQCQFRQIAWEIVVVKLNIFDVKQAHYSDRCFWFIT